MLIHKSVHHYHLFLHVKCAYLLLASVPTLAFISAHSNIMFRSSVISYVQISMELCPSLLWGHV
jgi:hypothetical protein